MTPYQQFLQNLLTQKLLTAKGEKIVPNPQTKRGLERKEIKDALNELTSFVEIEYSPIEKLYLVLNNTTSQPTCLFCGKNVGFLNSGDKKGQLKTYCSSKCSNKCPIRNKKSEEACLQRYGVPRVQQTEKLKQKRTNTMVERYGVTAPMQSSRIRSKITQTNIEKYGVCFPLESNKIYNKARDSNFANHGGVLSTQHQDVKEKSKHTLEKKYGVTHPSRIGVAASSLKNVTDKDWLTEQHHVFKKSHTEIALDLHLANTTVSRWFKNFAIPVQRFPSSLGEKQVCAFVQSLIPDSVVISGTRDVISPSELDIYVPSHNFAIEYNGIYRHSIDSGKNELYHLNKTKACAAQDINLLHVFDTEWDKRPDVVKSLISKHVGRSFIVSSENLSLQEVNVTSAETFRVENCLEEFFYEQCYGLYNSNGVVAALYVKGDTVKYVEKIFTEVSGGFERLFAFVNTLHENDVWFYVTDLRFLENPSLYGFTPMSFIQPTKCCFRLNTTTDIYVWNCGYMVWQTKCK